MSQFITDRVIAVGAIAQEPTVLDAIVASNSSYRGMSDVATTTKIDKIEKKWGTPDVDSLVMKMLSSSASRSLRRHREIDPRFLRITITDGVGAAIAATDKPVRYSQAPEYWQAIYAGGRGGIFLTDVLYGEETKFNYIAISVPVLDESSHQFIGSVTALVEVSSLFPALNLEKIGPTARTLLVKDDGTVISAPNVDLSMKLKSEEYAAVRDALATVQGREAGYVVVDMGGGERNIVGFADTGLKRYYSNLGWVILVSQNEGEASAPVRALVRFALLMVVLGLLMVVLLAVYFFLHRRQQFDQLEQSGRDFPPIS